MLSRRSAVLAALCALSSTAQGQRLRLTLVDSAGAAPVGGAIVTVLGADGQVQLETIIPEGGTRLLPIALAGRYRLRVRRVGYRPFLSDTIGLVAGEERALTLRLPEQRVPLAAVRAVARTRCTVGGPYDAVTAEALENARTTLLAATLAWRDQLEPIEAFAISRERTLGGTVVDSTRRMFAERIGEPFGSPDAGALHTLGYVTVDSTTMSLDRTYMLPSPRVMISEAFERTHCFALLEDPRDGARVGIRFEPLRSRRRPDVRGTMWLDRATGALTEIQFAFTGVPYPAPTPGATGSVHVTALPSGVRIVDRWHIRMPTFELIRSGLPVGDRIRQSGWKEDGGEARVKGAGRPDGDGAAVWSLLHEGRLAISRRSRGSAGASTPTRCAATAVVPTTRSTRWPWWDRGRRTVASTIGSSDLDAWTMMTLQRDLGEVHEGGEPPGVPPCAGP